MSARPLSVTSLGSLLPLSGPQAKACLRLESPESAQLFGVRVSCRLNRVFPGPVSSRLSQLISCLTWSPVSCPCLGSSAQVDQGLASGRPFGLVCPRLALTWPCHGPPKSLPAFQAPATVRLLLGTEQLLLQLFLCPGLTRQAPS